LKIDAEGKDLETLDLEINALIDKYITETLPACGLDELKDALFI
jgi:hypothetical protein